MDALCVIKRRCQDQEPNTYERSDGPSLLTYPRLSTVWMVRAGLSFQLFTPTEVGPRGSDRWTTLSAWTAPRSSVSARMHRGDGLAGGS